MNIAAISIRSNVYATTIISNAILLFELSFPTPLLENGRGAAFLSKAMLMHLWLTQLVLPMRFDIDFAYIGA
jgi:hypothetical protein